uniref:hydroxyacid oxidase 1-like n=1 Tax=Styela clava TaxID=7725 RepID=UPI0019399BA9|nr:hydroxyacid oxidase 1-like [Styela clava]
MASTRGEIDSAEAAEKLETLFTLSSMSTTSIEEIISEVPNGLKWFQLYVFKDRAVTKRLVERAEKNGFSALVLTVDLPVLGLRYADVRNKFSLPPNLSLKNFEIEAFGENYKVSGNKESGMAEFANNIYDSTLSWKDYDWLKSISNLPIILKGIISTEMALEAVEHGVDGIIVSNHGGRQLDGVSASINVLPNIVKIVNNKCEVYFDCGIRNGGDVAKAIALGAKAVFIGRSVIWGLACGGVHGVKKVLEILRDEFELTMKLLGVTSIHELQTVPNLVIHESKIFSNL